MIFRSEKNKQNYIRPFIYKKPSITNICIRMLILFSIQIVALLATKSYSAVIVILSGFLGAVASYWAAYFLNKAPFYNCLYSAVEGVMIGMLLPETYPPFAAFMVTFLVLVITKYIFINISNMWANMVAFSVVAAWFIGKSYFPDFMITTDLIPLKNSSLVMIQNGMFSVSKFDSAVTSFLNSTVFRILKVSVPEGYISLFWDTHSVIPAFRFNFLTILSSIVLFSDEAFYSMISSIFIIVYLALVRFFAPVFYGGLFNTGDILLALFTSGTLFTSVFLLQWFGTVPMSLCGKCIFSVACGILAFLIAGCGTSSVGMVFTVLIGNVLSLIIRLIEDKRDFIKTESMAKLAEGV